MQMSKIARQSNMDAIIFTGPTISSSDAARELEATYLPPAAEGDVYRAAEQHPRVIGIIDGYFERVPSVWHKEILWAMTQGIHVYGSASMGALRAAELATFGMVGVGSIFESYQDGVLEDDDEVALEHASEEFGFRAASDAMVNIRATLESAVTAGVLSETVRQEMQSIAKELFYPDRHYTRVLEIAAQRGVNARELAAFREWLPRGTVNRKREDAVAMLRAIRQALAKGLPPKRVEYTLQRTVMWDQARSHGSEEQS
jgi:hypothetical protein